MAYGLGLYAFLSIVELYITVPPQKKLSNHSNGTPTGVNIPQIDQQKSQVMVKILGSIESVFVLATTFVSQGDACPPPYTHVPGDISGPGSLDDQTHSLDNKTRSKII